MRTQALLTQFYVAWLSFPPPPLNVIRVNNAVPGEVGEYFVNNAVPGEVGEYFVDWSVGNILVHTVSSLT